MPYVTPHYVTPHYPPQPGGTLGSQPWTPDLERGAHHPLPLTPGTSPWEALHQFYGSRAPGDMGGLPQATTPRSRARTIASIGLVPIAFAGTFFTCCAASAAAGAYYPGGPLSSPTAYQRAGAAVMYGLGAAAWAGHLGRFVFDLHSREA